MIKACAITLPAYYCNLGESLILVKYIVDWINFAYYNLVMDNGVMILMFAGVLLLGVGFGKLAKTLKLPSVTGYLLAGILFGPYLLGGIHISGNLYLGFSEDFIDSVKIIYTIAFGFICFSLGEEAKVRKLKTLGPKVVTIAFAQTLAAFVLTGGVLTIIAVATNEKYITVPAALILGALAAASAPTAKFMITRQYKSEGEITTIMAPVVAMDDMFDIIIFSIVLSVVPAFDGGSVSVVSMLIAPLLEIVASAAVGIGLGVLLGYITKIYRIEGARIVVCIGFVLLAVALCVVSENAGLYLKPDGHGHGQGHLKLSVLLVCLMMGGAFSFVNHEHGIRKKLDSWTYPMFVAFFVFAGASFDVRVFAQLTVLWVALIYFAFRFVGKYFGTYLGCRLAGQSLKMRKTLGVTLLPQADVALSLAYMASLALAAINMESQGKLVVSVVFVAAIAFEIIGHIWMRSALNDAGENHGDTDNDIEPEEKEPDEKETNAPAV